MKNLVKKIEKFILKNWLKIRKRREQNRTLVSVEYGSYCAVAKIKRRNDNIGYRIIPTPQVGDYDIILTLDQLRPVRRYYFPIHRGQNNKKKLNSQTHRFGVFTAIGSHTIPRCLWDVNLCGDRIPSSAFIQTSSQKAIASVAFHALKISHSKKSSWRSQIEKTNWIKLLEKEIRKELNDESHNLQQTKIN